LQARSSDIKKDDTYLPGQKNAADKSRHFMKNHADEARKIPVC